MLVTDYRKNVTMESISEKYPNFESEYKKIWRAVCKRCLSAQASRNSTSTRLGGVTEESKNFFPYLNNDELRTVAKCISARFRNNRGHEDWDAWRKKLPKIFEDVEVMNDRVLTIFETIDGMPQSVSQIMKELTFTVTVCSDDGAQVFKWSGVPKDIAMTSISEITKALA